MLGRTLTAQLAVLSLALLVWVPAAASASDLILILDASGSMWGQIDGENKIVIARSVLGPLIEGLPEDQRVGLIAYGHRREGDCSDIELVAPLGPLDKVSLKATLNAIQPKGKTPLTRSVQEAFAVIERGDGATVILVSDGLETCDADPCAAVAAAKERGIDFVLHVVGFDVVGEDVSSLECAAQAGNGLFFSAENADQLAAALETAVALPNEIPAGGLAVKVVKDGALHDASIRVTARNSGEEINVSRTYYRPETNPRRLPLPAGDYAVRVRALGIRGAIDRTFEITLAEGEIAEREFDFTSGTLSVGARRNGELSDATVKIFLAGTREEVATGRTYTSASHNPHGFELTPGTYDVMAQSVEMDGVVRLRSDGEEVRPTEAVEVALDFASGTLTVGATRDGELLDASVNVIDVKEGRSVASGRIYGGPNGKLKEFILAPGSYRLDVRARDQAREQVEVVIEAGGAVEKRVELPAPL